ncbi:MAG: hypothetical protein JSV78_03100 [Phycisphaerales bacterium]|nr:MAG: hypothetical protein JSV78_03100 [Phycisphaerales bacterium]
MNRNRQLLFVLLASCTAWGSWTVGCSDPRFKAAQAARDERIEHLGELRADREQLHERSLEWVHGVAKRNEAAHEQKLDKTLTMIEERSARRLMEWHDQRPRRQAWFARLMGGAPERIPDTFAEMFY